MPAHKSHPPPVPCMSPHHPHAVGAEWHETTKPDPEAQKEEEAEAEETAVLHRHRLLTDMDHGADAGGVGSLDDGVDHAVHSSSGGEGGGCRPSAPPPPPPAHAMLAGIICTMGAHTLFGLHTIFSRHLQAYAAHPLPALSIIVLCNGAALLMFLATRILFVAAHRAKAALVGGGGGRQKRKEGGEAEEEMMEEEEGEVMEEEGGPISSGVSSSTIQSSSSSLSPPRERAASARQWCMAQWRWFLYSILANRTLWLFQIFLVARAYTNIISARFTKATYSTFMQLLTPFCVSILALALDVCRPMRRPETQSGRQPTEGSAEQKPTLMTFVFMITAALGGSLLVIAGGGSDARHGPPAWEDFFSADWSHFLSQLTSITWSDALGLSLSFISAFFLACYMILLKIIQTPKREETMENGERRAGRRSNSSNRGAEAQSLTRDQMLVVQLSVLSLGFLVPSLLLEDWSPYLMMESKDIFMLMGFAFFVYMLANWLNIASVKLVGPMNNSTVLAWRLVSTIVFSTFLLNEWIQNVWQMLGCVIVFVSVTLFMLYKRRQQSKHAKQQARAVVALVEEEDDVGRLLLMEGDGLEEAMEEHGDADAERNERRRHEHEEQVTVEEV